MAKLTPKTIQKRIDSKELKIKLLKSAKGFLRDDYTSGICDALSNAVLYKNGHSYNDCKEWTACNELTSYISRALGVYSWYPKWVREKHKDANLQYIFNYSKFNKQIKKSRKAWIDWMINCLQEDIDKLKGELNG